MISKLSQKLIISIVNINLLSGCAIANRKAEIYLGTLKYYGNGGYIIVRMTYRNFKLCIFGKKRF